MKCTVLKQKEVVELMKTEVNKVAEVVDIPKTNLRHLLTKCKWDKNEFLEKFYEGKILLSTMGKSVDVNEEENENFKRQGTSNESKKRKSSLSLAPEEPVKKTHKGENGETNKYCEICLEFFPTKKGFELSCKHTFCKECLGAYINSIVLSSFTLDCLMCPGKLCANVVADELVSELLDQTLQEKYLRLITNGFVSQNPLIKWCPAPVCSNAVKVEISAENQPGVKCKCGFRFCFACNNESHDLIPCSLLKEFEEVKSAQLANANWVNKHTKPCPKCHADIEKCGGCNHMSCKICRNEFCWICLSSWNSHSACNAQKAKNFQKNDLRKLTNTNTKRVDMKRSIQNDKKIYKLKRQQHVLEEKFFFIQEAVDVLLSCRRTLADSFIFYYFFENENDNQWILSRLNQEKLSDATEDLSQFLLSQVNEHDFHKTEQKTTTKTKYCKSVQRAFVDHIKDGFENSTW